MVHFLAPVSDELSSYHGKVLSRDRFRTKPDRRPNVDMLLFHYKQCAMKHLRGFSSSML